MTHMTELDSMGPPANITETDGPGNPPTALELDLLGGSMEATMPNRKQRNGFLVLGAWLLPAAVASAGLTMFASRGGDAKASVAQLRAERDEAREGETRVKQKLQSVAGERRALETERDQALAAEKAARGREQHVKAVLAFLQDNLLLAAGNPASWDANGLGQEATLREAVETAETKTAGAFADRPLVEASIREILGAAYLDLSEAAKAVRQFERALALREAEIGPDDPSAGDCRNRLAVAYRRAGRTDDASRLFDVRPRHGGNRDSNDR